MKLVIVEAPGKVGKIQKYLGSDYKVMASVGHITELAKGGEYNAGIDLDTFVPKYVISDDKKQVYDNIIQEAKKADEVFLAMDDDREGNAIAWHLKQRLAGITAPIKKVIFKVILKPDILKGIANPMEIDEDLFKAQEARRILDRLVGFTTSPLVTRMFNQNLSAGRVQTAALKLITDREKEIENFVPEKFWTIDAKFSHNNQDIVARYAAKLTVEQDAKTLHSKFQATKEYKVLTVENDEKKQFPNPPLITSKMLQIVNNKYKLSPKRISEAAQKLYEQGYVTYIRTDSMRTEPDMLTQLRSFIKDNNFPLAPKEVVYKNKDAAQDAHECIRPTDLNRKPDSSELDGDQQKVYEAIYDYFMMSQMQPAVFSTVRIIIESTSDKDCQLKITGKMLKSKGYLEYSKEIPDGSLPNLNIGDILEIDPKNIVLLDKKTTPPSRYNYNIFLKEIEDNGIGRPSTYAEIASKIENRHYVEKNEKDVYVPTKLGREVIDKLDQHFKFPECGYTAQMEEKLDKIALAKMDQKQVLKDFWNELSQHLNSANVSLKLPLCDKCSKPLRELTNKSTGEAFYGCTGYPKCRFTKQKEKTK